MTPHEQFTEDLIPLAAELVATVRDYGPEDVAAVLARVPDGRHDALAVVLAAMVDPDARPSDLLAWTQAGPVQSLRDEFTAVPDAVPAGVPAGVVPSDAFDEIAVQQAMRGYPVRLRRVDRLEVTRRLTALGVTAREIAERIGVEPRTVNRLRQALREDAA